MLKPSVIVNIDFNDLRKHLSAEGDQSKKFLGANSVTWRFKMCTFARSNMGHWYSTLRISMAKWEMNIVFEVDNYHREENRVKEEGTKGNF